MGEAMADRVKIFTDQLDVLASALHDIVEEFEKAGSRRNDLRAAVGRPYGKSDLQDAADEFEGRWDDRRKVLKENCEELAKHVEAVADGFTDFDLEAAAKFSEKAA